MKKILKERKDIVFYVKLYPLKIHKDAHWKAKSIVCKKSLRMLEDNFQNKVIPQTDCATKEIEQTIEIAESLGIKGTPSLVLPDGRIHFGATPAEQLMRLIDESN